LEDPADHKLLVPQKPFLFHYDGVRYHDVLASVAPELDRPLNARGLAAADFDNDGDLDLAIACNRGPLILLRADGAEARNWIKVSLEGKKSNRQGIGALVRVSSGGRSYSQAVGCQGSYLSQHATALILVWGTLHPWTGSRSIGQAAAAKPWIILAFANAST